MRILVTGCNGWIGLRVCKYLLASGVEVLGGDVQQSMSVELGKKGIRDYFSIDIRRPLARLDSEVDVVIHCAGFAHRPDETPEDREMFYAVNRDGTRNVLAWCEQEGIERFLYLSSIAFYDWGTVSTVSVTEDHPVALPTHYAKSKYEGEQLVSSSSLDWRIVRLATVFGEGDRANFSRMVNAMKKRLFPVPGRGMARKSVIPVDLAAELLAEFALLDNPPHQLINLGLPEAPCLREIVDAYHEICELPRCPKLPMLLARSMGVCGDLVAKILGKFPFTTDILRKLTTSTEVSVVRMLECFPNRKFGLFRDHLAECKDWYR